MLPSEFPEVQKYENLKRLLQSQLDMQFEDLRCLLRLPLTEYGLSCGCNFGVAAYLFNIISGASVCFYKPNINNTNNSRKKFRGVLRDYYPWEGEQIKRNDFLEVLYTYSRNLLAHSLGVGDGNTQVVLSKSPISPTQIQELEDSKNRPVWLPPTISNPTDLDIDAREYVVNLLTLYWGVHRMLHSLFSAKKHVLEADREAYRLSLLWRKLPKDKGKGEDSVRVEKAISE